MFQHRDTHSDFGMCFCFVGWLRLLLVALSGLFYLPYFIDSNRSETRIYSFKIVFEVFINK